MSKEVWFSLNICMRRIHKRLGGQL